MEGKKGEKKKEKKSPDRNRKEGEGGSREIQSLFISPLYSPPSPQCMGNNIDIRTHVCKTKAEILAKALEIATLLHALRTLCTFLCIHFMKN